MKKYLFKSFAIAAAVSITASCGNNTEANLTGNISADRDSVIIRSVLTDRSEASADTIVLNDGSFETTVTDTVPVWLHISTMPHYEGEKTSVSKILMLPGDRIKISGRLENPEISGSKLYDSLKDTEYYRLYKEKDSLRREIAKVYKNETDEARTKLNSLLDASQELDKRMNTAAMTLVKEHPDNIAAGFATLTMFDNDCIEATSMLKENVINGPLNELIENNVTAKKKSLEKQEKWNSLATGMQAADFKLKDLNGNEKTLASFKGKYLVLEFWGTWCPWCIKGLPMMRTYYEKYKSKVEFVSISCRDTDEAWRKCIEKYDMRWTQLFNGNDTEVQKSYNILGYPSKIIIDKEGKIVDKFLDEENTFYQKLDELFG